jgi:pyrroline-5-carboxylate reductase
MSKKFISLAARNLSTGTKDPLPEGSLIKGVKKLVLGDGNMMGAVLGKVWQNWQEANHNITIVKAAEPDKKRDGAVYYYGGARPPKGEIFSEVWSGLKPQVSMKELLKYSKYVDENTILVSLEAGRKMSVLAKQLGVQTVVRTMMNTNATIGRSLTAFSTTGNIEEKRLDAIVRDLRKIGDVYPIPEEQMNAFTAVAGSGPAYAHHLFGAISRTLQNCCDYSFKNARDFVLKVVTEGSINPPPYSEKVKNALLELEPSVEKEKEARGKGSLESILVKAVQALGETPTKEDLAAFVSGAVAKVSKSLVKASGSIGFSEEMSEAMVSAPSSIIKASAEFAKLSGKTFLDLKNSVTSVNGTTQAALAILESGCGRTIDELCEQSLKAACERGEQMGNPSGYSLKTALAELNSADPNALEEAKPYLVALYNAARGVLGLDVTIASIKPSGKGVVSPTTKLLVVEANLDKLQK